MSIRSAVPSEASLTSPTFTRRKWSFRNFDSFLVLLPSLVAIAIFVYGFIGITFYVAASNWRTVKADLSLHDPLFQIYGDLFSTARFQSDLRNTFVFTILFIGLSVAV